jgi:hypothetical protein
MAKYEYSVLPNDDRYEIASHVGPQAHETGLRILAQQAADDYHHEHDGWESSWPLVFVLYHEGRELGKFDVERETVPQFVAKRVLSKGSGS